MDNADPREELALATIEAFWAAYEQGSQEFFDFFTDDASIFAISAGLRFPGREAYRSFFGPKIGLQRRAAQVLDPEVRLMGEGALVTCHSRIRVHYRSVDSRVTLLLVAAGESFKVAHMHMSALQVPLGTGTSGLVEDIIGIQEDAEESGGDAQRTESLSERRDRA